MMDWQTLIYVLFWVPYLTLCVALYFKSFELYAWGLEVSEINENERDET